MKITRFEFIPLKQRGLLRRAHTLGGRGAARICGAVLLWGTLAFGCASESDPSASTADPGGRGSDVPAAAGGHSSGTSSAGTSIADSDAAGTSSSGTASSGTASAAAAWTPPRPRSVHERRDERERMVEVILGKSPMVTDGTVLRAMMDAPRHVFVHEQTRRLAYDDMPLFIGLGQTISQPYIVAYMTELLELDPASKVLEIGTGSGYQAAVLAHLTPHVYTMEIIEPLLERAPRPARQRGLRHGPDASRRRVLRLARRRTLRRHHRHLRGRAPPASALVPTQARRPHRHSHRRDDGCAAARRSTQDGGRENGPPAPSCPFGSCP